MDKDTKRRFSVFLKAGLPYTAAGMLIVLAGIYAVKSIFKESEYVTLYLFGWLALFWFVYQPLFRRRIDKVKKTTRY